MIIKVSVLLFQYEALFFVNQRLRHTVVNYRRFYMMYYSFIKRYPSADNAVQLTLSFVSINETIC